MASYRTKTKEQRYADKNGKTEVVIHVLSEEPTVASEDLAIARAFRPIYMSMTFCGLIWKSHKSSGMNKKVDCHTFHCCFMLVLLWYNAFHYIGVFDGNEKFGSADFIIKVSGIINAIQIALCLTAFIYFNDKHVPFFLRQWENYKLKHGGLTLTLMKKHMWRRLVMANVIFILFFSSVAMAFAFNPLFKSKYKYSLVPIIKYVPRQGEEPAGYVWSIVVLYILFSLNQTVIVVTGFCRLISLEFQKLSDEFAHTVTINSKTRQARMQRSSSQGALDVTKKAKLITYEVEQFRLRHFDLALLVGRLDNIVHAYLLFLYLFTIPLIVLLLFGAGGMMHMLLTEFSAYYSGISGLIYFCTTIIWISRSGTLLANSSRRSKEIAHKIDITTCSTEESMSIQILLHKISNDHTGLTLGKVVNIDKGLFITLFTVILTYLMWMLKLRVAFQGHEDTELAVMNGTSTETPFQVN